MGWTFSKCSSNIITDKIYIYNLITGKRISRNGTDSLLKSLLITSNMNYVAKHDE